MLTQVFRSGACLLALLGVGLLSTPGKTQVTYSASFPQPPPPTTVLDYTGTTRPAGGSPVFNEPVPNGNSIPTTLSTTATLAPYSAKTFTVASDGVYDITSDGDGTFDNVIFVYKSFDPANPLDSILVGNRAANGTSHSAITGFSLAAGSYVLVTAGATNTAVGAFTNTVTKSATVGAPIYTGTGDTTPVSGSPTYNRLVGTSGLSSIGTAVYYGVHSFTVPTTGTYNITSSTTYENYLFLYKDSFNPAAPQTNVLSAVDGFPNSGSLTSQSLTAGTTYYLIATTYDNGVTGPYTLSVNSAGTTVTVGTYSGTTAGKPTFKRPNANGTSAPTGLNSGTGFAYDTYTYTAPSTGTYKFVSQTTTPTYDNFTFLYAGSFNAASPLTNALIGNDDITSTSSGFSYNLTAGATYVFVNTSYSSTKSGPYTLTISTVTAPQIVAFSGNLTAGSGASFNRPTANGTAAPTVLSGTTVFYKTNTFNVTTEGDYRISDLATSASPWNNFLVIYSGAFDPANPLTNAILATDGPALGDAGVSLIHLPIGPYTLVTTGSAVGNFGPYSISVSPLTTFPALLTYSDSTTLGVGPTFNRAIDNGTSAPTSLSGIGTAVYYSDKTFTVPADGYYSFTSVPTNPAGWDHFIMLYQDSFDPNDPLTNALIASDAGSFSNYQLTAGTTYILVTTSFTNGVYGDFHNTLISGSATAYPPTIPDNDPAGLPLTITVPDTFNVTALNSVTVQGLNHTYAGDLAATLTHGSVTIELFDRLNRLANSGFGSSADFAGDYTFVTGGTDLATTVSLSVIPPGSYAPYLNGTAGESYTFTGDFTAFNGMSVAGDWTLNIADLGAGISGTYTGFSFNVTPSVVTTTVSGTLTLDSIAASAPAQDITFTFHPATGADIVKTVAVGPSGTYTITGLGKAAYTLRIKGAKYLAVSLPVDTTGGNVTGVNATLPGGDANNDNRVDVLDFGILVNAYGTALSANNGYDPMADFNVDGSDDVLDFGVLVNNYGSVGAP